MALPEGSFQSDSGVRCADGCGQRQVLRCSERAGTNLLPPAGGRGESVATGENMLDPPQRCQVIQWLHEEVPRSQQCVLEKERRPVGSSLQALRTLSWEEQAPHLPAESLLPWAPEPTRPGPPQPLAA